MEDSQQTTTNVHTSESQIITEPTPITSPSPPSQTMDHTNQDLVSQTTNPQTNSSQPESPSSSPYTIQTSTEASFSSPLSSTSQAVPITSSPPSSSSQTTIELTNHDRESKPIINNSHVISSLLQPESPSLSPSTIPTSTSPSSPLSFLSQTTSTPPTNLEQETEIKQAPQITLHTNAEPPSPSSPSSSSSTPLSTPPLQLPLDLEHESCLKQQLLRHAVQKEMDIFMQNPNCIHDLLYLEYIFNQTRSFPLLSSHEKAKEKLEEFILTLPHFMTITQRASKLDQQNKKLRVLVAGTFHINFKTPLEREEDKKMLLPVSILLLSFPALLFFFSFLSSLFWLYLLSSYQVIIGLLT